MEIRKFSSYLNSLWSLPYFWLSYSYLKLWACPKPYEGLLIVKYDLIILSIELWLCIAAIFITVFYFFINKWLALFLALVFGYIMYVININTPGYGNIIFVTYMSLIINRFKFIYFSSRANLSKREDIQNKEFLKLGVGVTFYFLLFFLFVIISSKNSIPLLGITEQYIIKSHLTGKRLFFSTHIPIHYATVLCFGFLYFLISGCAEIYANFRKKPLIIHNDAFIKQSDN
jgi:hypothetical protein